MLIMLKNTTNHYSKTKLKNWLNDQKLKTQTLLSLNQLL